MQDPATERTFPPCPNCGAEGHQRTWRETIARNGGGLSVASDAHHIFGSEVAALICRSCGNVQLFVNPEDFANAE